MVTHQAGLNLPAVFYVSTVNRALVNQGLSTWVACNMKCFMFRQLVTRYCHVTMTWHLLGDLKSNFQFSSNPSNRWSDACKHSVCFFPSSILIWMRRGQELRLGRRPGSHHLPTGHKLGLASRVVTPEIFAQKSCRMRQKEWGLKWRQLEWWRWIWIKIVMTHCWKVSSKMRIPERE